MVSPHRRPPVIVAAPCSDHRQIHMESRPPRPTSSGSMELPCKSKVSSRALVEASNAFLGGEGGGRLDRAAQHPQSGGVAEIPVRAFLGGSSVPLERNLQNRTDGGILTYARRSRRVSM